jgi:predicted dehydrogenase
MSTLNLVVIGLGRWGPNHVRNFSVLKDCRVVAVADMAEATCKRIAASDPGVDTYRDYAEVLRRDDVQGVVVCTPTSTHARVCTEALHAGKHVLCEKPLATTGPDAWGLARLARERKRVLMMGHVFLFNPGIETLLRIVQNGVFGKVYCLSAVRQPGPVPQRRKRGLGSRVARYLHIGSRPGQATGRGRIGSRGRTRPGDSL